MCGIVGCVGHHNAVGFTINGLDRLLERGYDSMGIAFPRNDSIEDPSELNTEQRLWTLGGLKVVKGLSKIGLRTIEDSLDPSDHEVTTALGHTRWATHGEPGVYKNTHPHINEEGTVAVAHNGTIENHKDLRKWLEKRGYNFVSDTDTEVVPHLFQHYLEEGFSAENAFTQAIRRLEGAYAILAYTADRPDTLFGARKGGALVFGVNESEHFASSSPRVWADQTKKAVFLEHDEIGMISKEEGYDTWSTRGTSTKRPPQELGDDFETEAELDRTRFDFWMEQEIFEQPEALREAMGGRVFPAENLVKLGGLEDPEIREKLRQTERILIVGCGTSYHAGLVGKRLFEEIARIPTEVHVASEFQYSDAPISPNSTVIGITQSGETIDTNASIEKANKLGLLTLGINNSPGSTIDRITKAGVHNRARRERAVASTKAYTSQIVILAEMALALSKTTSELHQPLMQELMALPNKIEQMLKDTSAIEAVAKKYVESEHFVFIGRGYDYPSALEGALKLKEISYINANGYAAGELKHGPLALIEKSHPTFAIATNSSVYDKVLNNIYEIKARDGQVIALATEGNEGIKEVVDNVLYAPGTMEQLQPVINSIVMQLFAYYIAVERGNDPDFPRNLAKSVTVE